MITHDGQTKNGFVECKDNTMNTNGSGTFTAGESESGEGDEEEGGHHERHHYREHNRRGREPEEGRVTLDRIEY